MTLWFGTFMMSSVCCHKGLQCFLKFWEKSAHIKCLIFYIQFYYLLYSSYYLLFVYVWKGQKNINSLPSNLPFESLWSLWTFAGFNAVLTVSTTCCWPVPSHSYLPEHIAAYYTVHQVHSWAMYITEQYSRSGTQVSVPELISQLWKKFGRKT